MAKGAITVKVSGLKECDAALAELSKGMARGVLKRVLMAAGQPMADAASANTPKDTHELERSIIVSSKIDNRIGKKEYSDVMKSGGTKAEAVEALKGARRGGGESFALVFVGPTKARSKAAAIKRRVQEFGSKQQSGKPYMRPAFDALKYAVLEKIKELLMPEIEKTIARAKKRAAAKLLRGK